MRFIYEFHRNGKLTKGINSTFIALIPKVDSPQRLNDFRPISLVGSLYKILAKVLANRLRMVIGGVISESQTAFVKDRQIFDRILIANKVVDEALMGKMEFPTLWRKWMRECVYTATASILVNGSPTGEFPFQRGLRQGDPLCPFLFLLAAEGMNVLMTSMVERNVFTGYRVGDPDPVMVSHLKFADDTLLLGVKSWANVRALRSVLVLFELMSGLKVNFHKSMLVGVNISESWLHEAVSGLRCKVGKAPFLYLGLPISGDLRRLGFWEPVLTHIRNRLSGWQSRFLSFGGRLVLLKSVLTSLSVYALSFFKAPAARYWVKMGRLGDGGRGGSSWWRKIVRIREGVCGIGGDWFGESVTRRVGDGSDTFFWSDPWLGGAPLCERFGRLYDLVENKSSIVAEMFSAGWEGGGEAWVWRRQLWVWEEEMLRECQTLLLPFTLQAQSPDVWRWQPDPDTGYSVRSAYQLLTSHVSFPLGEAEDLVWHKQVPLKVSIFAWRLLRDRLPTKANLVARGIITPEFTYSTGGLRARRSFLQIIWLACGWVVWTERNSRLFRDTTSLVDHLLDKVKMFFFRWLKPTSVTLVTNYHCWWSNSLLCLGID
ncbi:hypothetical protein P8452_57279 [Trifolium repens]|nr:hypothetical protein P8452_57279 [Trifolium repens]